MMTIPAAAQRLDHTHFFRSRVAAVMHISGSCATMVWSGITNNQCHPQSLDRSYAISYLDVFSVHNNLLHGAVSTQVHINLLGVCLLGMCVAMKLTKQQKSRSAGAHMWMVLE
eukprot:TRINITY_DN1129_c0_g1_i45.p3 TRINITY_DN1129_c0_g1~~TRINITY_DN1129_c0_g1_i45.p3  ORF type:complete len:113 (+),score=0.57 TRINITY_DN1129_c0_g1_i45:162-500(+)